MDEWTGRKMCMISLTCLLRVQTEPSKNHTEDFSQITPHLSRLIHLTLSLTIQSEPAIWLFPRSASIIPLKWRVRPDVASWLKSAEGHSNLKCMRPHTSQETFRHAPLKIKHSGKPYFLFLLNPTDISPAASSPWCTAAVAEREIKQNCVQVHRWWKIKSENFLYSLIYPADCELSELLLSCP